MNIFKTLLVGSLLINGLFVKANNQSNETIIEIGDIQQSQITPTQKGINRADQLKIDVDLTSTQYEKVKELFITVELKLDAVINGNDIHQDRKQEFIDGNKNDEAAVLKTILTADQWNTYSNL